MSLLSSVALVPCVAVAEPAGLDLRAEHPDRKLLALGKDLDIAYAEENACYQESERLSDPCLTTRRRVLRFKKRSAADRALVRLMKDDGMDWSDGAIFGPREIQEIRGLVPTGRKDIDRRIEQLIEAEDKRLAFHSRPEVVDIERRCEEARARTSSIVDLIERSQARAVEGLVVKAKAVRWCRTGDLSDEELSGAATDTRICQSILVDLMAIAEAGPLIG